MLKKLTDIYIHPSKRPLSNPPKSHTDKIKEKALQNSLNIRKWELLKIAQDNQLLNKKLLESKSFFKIKSNHSNNLTPNLHNVKFVVSKFSNSTKSKDINKESKFSPEKQIEENKNIKDIKAQSNQDFFKKKINEHTKRNFLSYNIRNIDWDSKNMNNNFKTDYNSNFSTINKKELMDNSKAFSMFNFTGYSDKLNFTRTISVKEDKNVLYKRKAFIPSLSIVNVSFVMEPKR